MRPRPPVNGRGIFSGTGLIITGLAATLAALIFPIWSYADRSGTAVDVLNAQTVSTRYGPLSALDREFVTKVRLAGLWELPAGQQALQKGTTQAVRTAGQHLVDGHTFLDGRVRDVASQLGLALPNEPNDQQKQWLATLSSAQGVEYDRQFANILRIAHGRVFSVVAQVRATTRNSLVRALADDANTTVLDHIKILEATGYVDWDALAQEMASGSTPPITNTPGPPGPTNDPAPAIPVTPPASPTYSLPPPATSPPPSGS
ncbi:Tat pathway signal sequence domain protein [Streptomyces sp. GKU 895]|nr:Tat pathway signal sequence domain protein [Streptomyces sp. GKU 895]